MKLIDLLVKELPSRGGWPEEAKIMSQDAAGMINAHRNERLVFLIDQFWTGTSKNDACKNFSPFYLKKATDWNTNTVTREQYESALEASKAVAGHDGWIQWAGGECPVDSDAIVEVKYRKPNQYQFNNDRAGDFSWTHDGIDGDIIAYRLHNPEIKSRANDDKIEQDLNECIGHGADTAWNGEGLPPVGIKCEHCPGGTTQHEWEVVTVAGVHKNTSTGFTDYWLVRENGSSYIVGNPYRFRPLRTEADKARDEAIQSMTSVIDYRNGCSSKPMAGWLYDAIAAGKIPGVRLEGK